MSLCNVASVSIVREEHFTRKNSFVFGLGAETSHVEEFTLGTGMEVHTGQWRSQRDRTGGERRRFKECRGYDTALIGKGSGINPSKYTVHVMMISNITSSSHNYLQNNNNNNNSTLTLTNDTMFNPVFFVVLVIIIIIIILLLLLLSLLLLLIPFSVLHL